MNWFQPYQESLSVIGIYGRDDGESTSLRRSLINQSKAYADTVVQKPHIWSNTVDFRSERVKKKWQVSHLFCRHCNCQ